MFLMTVMLIVKNSFHLLAGAKSAFYLFHDMRGLYCSTAPVIGYGLRQERVSPKEQGIGPDISAGAPVLLGAPAAVRICSRPGHP